MDDPLIIIPAAFCAFFALVSIRFNLVMIFAYVASAGWMIPLLGRELYFYPFLFLIFIFFLKIISIKQSTQIHWHRFEKLLLISTLSGILYFILARWGILGKPEATELYAFVAGPMPAILFFILLLSLRMERITPEYLLKINFIILGLICFMSLSYILLNADLSKEVGKEFLGVNPNNFGALCASTLIYLLIYRPQKILGSIGVSAISFCLLTGLLLSQSRAAILALLLSITIFALYRKSFRYALIFAPFLVAIVFIIALNIPLGVNEKIALIQSSYYSGDVNLATSGRLAMWLGGIKFMQESSLLAWLFGSGQGTFSLNAALYTGLVDLNTHAHNHYLNLLITGGIWALGLYLWLMWQICSDCYKYFSQSQDSMALAVFFMMITYLFCDLFGPRFAGNALYFVWPLVAIFYSRFDSFNIENNIDQNVMK